MILVGLTGGIGSGKTTVAGMFEELGVPVYNSDDRAKLLMTTSHDLKSRIMELLGDQAYIGDELDRAYIAEKVFTRKELLKELNAIVHPAVREDFAKWASQQNTPYVIQEAAILFENGAYESFDQMILVTAPKQIRLERIMLRDEVPENNILARMNYQWEDDKKIALSHFIIENTDLEKTRHEVKKIHQKLAELAVNNGF